MKLSDEGIAKLISREGVRYKTYLDSKGIPTIGVGHTGSEVHDGLRWTDEQVTEAFKKDVTWAEDAVNSVTYSLKQYQFDALVSFVFNVGASAWHKSTMKKMINSGMLKQAALQFDRWVYPKEITGRRMQEKAQFLGK